MEATACYREYHEVVNKAETLVQEMHSIIDNDL